MLSLASAKFGEIALSAILISQKRKLTNEPAYLEVSGSPVRTLAFLGAFGIVLLRMKKGPPEAENVHFRSNLLVSSPYYVGSRQRDHAGGFSDLDSKSFAGCDSTQYRERDLDGPDRCSTAKCRYVDRHAGHRSLDRDGCNMYCERMQTNLSAKIKLAQSSEKTASLNKLAVLG